LAGAGGRGVVSEILDLPTRGGHPDRCAPASGKERLALAVAERLGGEIISADSMKVYRGLDIGTAKPDAEARRRVPHHLVDVAEPTETFSAARWLALADAAIAEVAARGRVPIVSGGTPFYLKALLEGLFEGPAADPDLRRRLAEEARAGGTEALHARLARVDPAAARRIHPNDLRRIVRALEVWEKTGRPISDLQRQWGAGRRRYRPLLVAIRRSPEDLTRRITERARRMLEAGLVDEVRRLVRRAGGPMGAEPHSAEREARPAEEGVRRAGGPMGAEPHSAEREARPAEEGKRGAGADAAEGGPETPGAGAEVAGEGLARGPRQALGYAEVLDHLAGRLAEADLLPAIVAHTRQFARRQMTWIRRFEGVVWLPAEPDTPTDALADRVVALWHAHLRTEETPD